MRRYAASNTTSAIAALTAASYPSPSSSSSPSLLTSSSHLMASSNNSASVMITSSRRGFVTASRSPLLALERVSGSNAFTTMSITGAVKTDEDQIKGESGISLMRCLKPHQSEAFYFEDDAKQFCRLCQEETTMPPKGHIAASSRQSHTNHTCREVVLDSLTLWNRRGFNVDNIVQCWSHALYHHSEFPRIPGLTDWRWPVNVRAQKITELLGKLRDMGYIDLSLAIAPPDNTDATFQSRKRLAFERLECIGDNSWGNNMSNRMMHLFPDRQWIHSQSAYSFNCFRDACEMNLNLEAMYDMLDLGSLMPPLVREKVGNGKVKADVFESILGELQVWMWGFEPELYDSAPYIEVNGEAEATIHTLLQHTLTEIYDIVMLAYCQELTGTAIPLSKELATRHVWAVENPPVFKNKDRTSAAKKRSVNSRKIMLPPLEAPTPTPMLTAALKNQPNPLKRALVPETIDRFSYRDVFEVLIPSMEVTENKSTITVDQRRKLRNSRREMRDAWIKAIGTLKLPIVLENTIVDEEEVAVMGLVGGEETVATGSASSSLSKKQSASDDFLEDLDAIIPSSLAAAAAAEEDDVYFRDQHYELSPTPVAKKASSGSSTASTASTSSAFNDATPTTTTRSLPLPPRTSTIGSEGDIDNMLYVFPPLASERDGLQQLQGLVVGGTVCLYEPSALVPADVKPPPAGVITDKNLYMGLFLNTIIEAQSSAADEYF